MTHLHLFTESHDSNLTVMSMFDFAGVPCSTRQCMKVHEGIVQGFLYYFLFHLFFIILFQFSYASCCIVLCFYNLS